MTQRLYYTDAMLTSFDATVTSCVPAADGFDVFLDRTAFYPTSGGQPFDTGRLGEARVVDVIDHDSGEIAHRVEARLEPGARVHGEIDWRRRLDHMQQHTGQHLLSAAFDRCCQARTLSFHLGAATATIDLDREVTSREIASAVDMANQVVWENRAIRVRFATEAEAAQLPLRKEPVRTGALRLIDVTDFDLSACGGTHVPQTGMVGIIAVTSSERLRGGSRIAFVCGGRALRSHDGFRDAAVAATRQLSVSVTELPAAIERLQAETKNLGRSLKQLQEEVASHRAAQLRAQAEDINGLRGVLRVEHGWDAAALKTLAIAIVNESDVVAVLVGDGHPAPVVVARSAGVELDANAWIRQASAALGGRGGGRPELAQGGLTATQDQILAFAKSTLRKI